MKADEIKIKNYLLQLGFQPNLKGYKLLSRLIELSFEGQKIIQAKLQEMTTITDENIAKSVLSEITSLINNEQAKLETVIAIHLGIIRFSYYTWPKAPAMYRHYPVVILMQRDEQLNANSYTIVQKQVALANAVSYQNKIEFYALHAHWKDIRYIKDDALMMLKYAKEADNTILQEAAQKIIRVCDNYDKDNNDKT